LINLFVPNIQRFTADTLRHAVTWTFDPLTLNVLVYRLSR